MRLRTLGLLATCLLSTTVARAGEIFYGYNMGQPGFQIIRMDESGANKIALFPPDVAKEDEARRGDVSHASYATAFAQGRMWLCVPNGPVFPNGIQYNEIYVFAQSPTGQLVYRQVTNLLADGLYVDYANSAMPRWAVDDGFVSAQVEDPVGRVSYLVRIDVTGAEIAADNFAPIPFHDPANPGALNPRIEILCRVPWGVNDWPAGAMKHTWNFEGTQLAYSSDVGWRVKTVGPLGTFAGSTNYTLDPVLLNLNSFIAYDDLHWRPVAGSDQLVLRGTDRTKNGKSGIFYAYANTLTHSLFIANGATDPRTKVTSNYCLPTWSADGNTVVMQYGYQFGNPPTTWYICKVPAAGGTVVPLTPISNTTARLCLYGAR